MRQNKIIANIFIILICAALTAPLWVSKELLFPFVTTKAFFFRIIIEAALPFYVFLLIAEPTTRPSFKNPLTVAVIAFWIINLFSALAGVNQVKSFWGNFERMGGVFYLLHLTLLYFYIAAAAGLGGKYIKRVLDFAILTAVLVSLNGILTKAGLLQIVADPSLPRVSSTLGNPIYIGSFLIVPMFLSVFFALQHEGWKRYVYWAAAALQLWTIFLSGTRGAIVGLILGLAVAFPLYFIFSRNRAVKVYGLILTFLAGLALVLMFIFHDKLPQGTMLYRVFNLRDSNTYARLIQWRMAFEGYKERPILGVGPENYYYLSNKYYNPEMYKHDASWFDKPHNFLLEILVTNGALGFAAYLSIIGGALWIVFVSLRRQWLALREAITLACCLLVYQFQNLFVFDTVPASLMFFVLLGAFAYLWQEAQEKPKDLNKNIIGMPSGLAWASAGLSGLVALYMAYAGNIMPAYASRMANYGLAYGGSLADVKKAEDFFERAENNRFNFDLPETASKHAQFTAAAMQAPDQTVSPELKRRILEQNISVMEEVVGEVDNNPIYWVQLSSLYIYKSFSQQYLDPAAIQAAIKAIDLVPRRLDPYYPLVQIRLIQRDYVEAEKLLKKMMSINPANTQIVIQLASVYREQGKIEQALQLAQPLVDSGHKFGSPNEFLWLTDYYEQQKDYSGLEKLYNQLIVLQPENIEGYFKLIRVYIHSGQKEKARSMLNLLLEGPYPDKTEIKKLLEEAK